MIFGEIIKVVFLLAQVTANIIVTFAQDKNIYQK